VQSDKLAGHQAQGDGPDDAGAVAIIGMAGRFPGARNLTEFWDNLRAGRESITYFTPGQLARTLDPSLVAHPDYVPAHGILLDVDLFDAAFFGITPLEAQVMDPQQRIFLELGWEALENAGYDPAVFVGRIGTFAGMNNHAYYLENVLRRPDLVQKFGAFQAMLANEKDFLATRLSYKLGLTGPSENIYTACSTSLVTIVRGVQSLLSFECDMALAGGISVQVPQNAGYLYQEGSMLSPDGHCRPFDAAGQGTTFNDGAGIVVLRRLEDALADGDRIIALIRGTGLNNDGAGKVSFTAPSVQGQADAVRMAIAMAGIDPASISFVETHGTGTPLGDPIEVAALGLAFDLPAGRKTCILGSVKSNIGHTVHAAGVAGVIKTALSLAHRQIPPTLHYEKPNPKIDFDQNPFHVNNRLIDWPAGDTPRRAGVSSFGVGGTNAHVVMEEAAKQGVGSSGRRYHLMPLSARTEAALDHAVTNLAGHLEDNGAGGLADAAATLQTGRRHFNHRCFGVFGDAATAAAAAALRENKPRTIIRAQVSTRDPGIVFMFPGQGSQHAGMGRGLYETEPVYRQVVDEGAERLIPELGLDLRELLHPAPGDEKRADTALKETRLTQPALFLVEYALGRLWQSVGVEPAAMIGHSIGEFAAACLSGVFSFPDALRLVAARGRLMQGMPPGDMLSVRLDADSLVARLPRGVELAADNAPQLCVVAGEAAAITDFAARLTDDGILCKLVRTSHAFHSVMMEPVLTAFADIVRSVALSAPRIPFVSCATGDWITAAQAVDPQYWGRHLREPVLFRRGLARLLADSDKVFLEVGPGTAAVTLARQQLTGKDTRRAIPTLGAPGEAADDDQSRLTAVGQLWLAGKDIAWGALYSGERRARTALPTYPFERKRFWADVDDAAWPSTAIAEPARPAMAVPVTVAQQDFVREEANNMQSMLDMVIAKLKAILEETSGIELAGADQDATFMELGFDSLFLTQAAIAIGNEFKVPLAFRQLIEDFPTVATLGEHLAGIVNPADFQAAAQAPAPAGGGGAAPALQVGFSAFTHAGGGSSVTANGVDLQALINQQLDIMARQLALVSGGQAPAGAAMPVPRAPVAAPTATSTAAPAATPEETDKPAKPFGAQARIVTHRSEELTAHQQAALKKLFDTYIARTRASKAFTAENRDLVADPRVVSGFRPLFKEVVYPIVVNRSKGAYMWDLDGNRYVDMLNGFGSNFFGYSPDFINEAVSEQLRNGIEIGPQHPLVADVSALMREFTGLDRFGYCNTGSEAVLGCVRMARTVTGRKLVATFTGDYHGIFDEVIVRGTPSLRSLPAAPGIMASAVANILVLDYDSPESLRILKERSGELAAILVEPVQSRHPDLQPGEFLKQLRALATECGAALIIDEVITGFRIHPGGAQAYFGVEADIASYGKVAGGGYPIGIVGGKKRFMDALDGGSWQYGDESFPEIGVTYFAGTFVRHPLALAASKAALTYLKQAGPELQKQVNLKAEKFARALNTLFRENGTPFHCQQFGSLMKLDQTEEHPFNELFYYHLRARGVHIWFGFPIFLTMAHTDADIEFVLQAFRDSVADMQAGGFFPAGGSAPVVAPEVETTVASAPPVAGARLGRTPEGDPAWFVEDPERPGKYVQIGADQHD
jgi:acyl transferase domain-containing protein